MYLHVFKVTKYDPAHFADGYFGPLDVVSDQGPREAAYLTAVETFAAETGVTSVLIREPGVGGGGLEPAIEGYGLAGLFPPDLTGYHDGARVPISTAVELVRAMLRDNGAWCRLEDERFFVHVGYDQYMYIGSSEPCEDAMDRVRASGLFPARVRNSPLEFDERERADPRPADDAFWAEVSALAAERGTVLLREQPCSGISRWHRLRAGDVPAGLAPRAHLQVWPELNEDVAGEFRKLDDLDDPVEVVREDRDGLITRDVVFAEDRAALVGELAMTRSAAVRSVREEEPLAEAVLPDDDGVVRVRWSV